MVWKLLLLSVKGPVEKRAISLGLLYKARPPVKSGRGCIGVLGVLVVLEFLMPSKALFYADSKKILRE